MHDNIHSPSSTVGHDTDHPARFNVEAQGPAELSVGAAQRLSVLGEMTGGIAHDFRNILTIIEFGLRRAERCANEPEQVRTYVAGAREGIVRGLRLTSQLLAFARQRELQACAADANSLLKNLELFLKYGAGSSVRVAMDLSSRIPNCLVDPSQFAAAILNLVINARDAMPNGGDVQICTARYEAKPDADDAAAPGVYVRVRVEDNGQGMSEQVIQRIFEPFFTTKGEKGTGLGIPQVCAFMRHVGGHVNVASEQGCGTRFDLLFPAVEPSAVPGAV